MLKFAASFTDWFWKVSFLAEVSHLEVPIGKVGFLFAGNGCFSCWVTVKFRAIFKVDTSFLVPVQLLFFFPHLPGEGC